MYGLKDQGGGGLINLSMKDKASKLQWVIKLKENKLIKIIAYELLRNPIKDAIWSVELSQTHVKKMFSGHDFWHQVLHNWLEIAVNDPLGQQEVKNEIIWYTSNICIKGNPIIEVKSAREP